MKLNEVNIDRKNEALISLIDDFSQILPIDTNFLIPPDRSKTIKNVQPIPFKLFEKIWIKPLLQTFPYLSIHEAVYQEIHSSNILSYIDELIYGTPPGIMMLRDPDLDIKEAAMRNTIEKKIAIHTNYDPIQDNKADRGEVKSLSHIAAKSLLYFCSHDSNALRLIDQADKLETNLDNVNALRTYEVLYYLIKMQMGNKEGFRTLYRYLYFLSPSDKKANPSWGDFINSMDELYDDDVQKSKNKPIPPTSYAT